MIQGEKYHLPVLSVATMFERCICHLSVVIEKVGKRLKELEAIPDPNSVTNRLIDLHKDQLGAAAEMKDDIVFLQDHLPTDAAEKFEMSRDEIIDFKHKLEAVMAIKSEYTTDDLPSR